VFLTESDLDAVAASIGTVESRTSGEIRVHLERRLPRDQAALDRARALFTELGMHGTRARSGVLIYLALQDRALAIVGDDGVHAKVGDAYWAEVRDVMVERLRRGAPREALVSAVEHVGEVLARHFPRRPDDVDELSNEVSTSE
jgi:uncharacterized membrane protein